MARRKLHELMPGEKPGWRKGPNWVPASGGKEKPFKTRTGRRLQYVWDTRSGDHAYLDLDTDMILSPKEADQALAMDSVQPKVKKEAAKDPWDLTFQKVTGKPLPPKKVKKEGMGAPTSAQIRNRAESLKSSGVRGEQLTTALRREFGSECQDSTEKAMYDIGEVVNRKTLARLVKEELFNFKFERLLTEGYERHVNDILSDAGIGGYHWSRGTMHFGSAKIMAKAKEVLLQHKDEIYQLPPMDVQEAKGAEPAPSTPAAPDTAFPWGNRTLTPDQLKKLGKKEAVGGNWKKDTTSGSYGAPIKSKCPSCGNPWSVDLGVANGMHFHGCLKCNKTFIPNAGVKQEAGNKFQSIGSLGNKPPSDDISKMPGEEEAEKALKGEGGEGSGPSKTNEPKSEPAQDDVLQQQIAKAQHDADQAKKRAALASRLGFKEGTTGPRFADVQNRARILLGTGMRFADVANQLAKEFPDAKDMIKQAVYVVPKKEQAMGEALNKLRQYIREAVRQTLKEKWEDGGDIKKLDKYGKEQQPISALKSQAANLRDKEERSAADSKKLKQLNFAIRARTGWGKAKESANPTLKKEVAPKGWEGTVKAMKKHKDISNPWALAHYMKNKGMKSHKESVSPKIREAIRNEIRKAIKEADVVENAPRNSASRGWAYNTSRTASQRKIKQHPPRTK